MSPENFITNSVNAADENTDQIAPVDFGYIIFVFDDDTKKAILLIKVKK